MSPQKCGVGAKATEVQRQSRAHKRHCKGRFWSLRSIQWKRLICITDDCCKNHGCYCKITRLWWTSSWCCICLHPGKIGGCSKIAQNSEIRKSRCLDTSSTTQMAKIMGQNWRSRGSSRTKLVRTPICWPFVGKAVRRSFIGTWMGKRTELGMYVRSSKTRLVSVNICGWLKKS